MEKGCYPAEVDNGTLAETYDRCTVYAMHKAACMAHHQVRHFAKRGVPLIISRCQESALVTYGLTPSHLNITEAIDQQAAKKVSQESRKHWTNFVTNMDGRNTMYICHRHKEHIAVIQQHNNHCMTSKLSGS